MLRTAWLSIGELSAWRPGNDQPVFESDIRNAELDFEWKLNMSIYESIGSAPDRISIVDNFLDNMINLSNTYVRSTNEIFNEVV